MDKQVDKLVIAISSRALFDLSDSHRVYVEQGLEAYQQYQIAHEDEPLAPGDAFGLVNKLLNLNKLLRAERVEVILLSRNSADTGLRVFNSIRHYGLHITRAAFCGGDSPYRYIAAFNSHLFLSTDGRTICSHQRIRPANLGCWSSRAWVLAAIPCSSTSAGDKPASSRNTSRQRGSNRC